MEWYLKMNFKWVKVFIQKDNTQCDNEIHIIDSKNNAQECLNAANSVKGAAHLAR